MDRHVVLNENNDHPHHPSYATPSSPPFPPPPPQQYHQQRQHYSHPQQVQGSSHVIINSQQQQHEAAPSPHHYVLINPTNGIEHSDDSYESIASRLRDTDMCNRSLATQLESKERELETCRKNQDHLRADTYASQRKCLDLEQLNKQLNDELSTRNQYEEALEEKLRKQTSTTNLLQEYLDEAKAKSLELEIEAKRNNSKLAEQEEKISGKKARIWLLLNELKTSEVGNDRLTKEVEEKKRDLARMQRRIYKLEDTLTRCEDKNISDRATIAYYIRSKKTLESRLKSFPDLSSKCDELEKTIDDLKWHAQSQERRLKENLDVIKEQQIELACKEKRIKSLEANYKKFESKNTTHIEAEPISSSEEEEAMATPAKKSKKNL